MSDLVKLTIDGVPLEVPKGTLLVEAAKKVKQEIPVYCYHTKLGPAGLCRVCLVEIEGMPKLQIACNTPVTDGMVVHTQNDKVNTGRGFILEALLVNHPLDCPICDKGGECDLQDYAMAYGRGASDVADPKQSKPKRVDLGPTIVLDEERCVVCQRCVRFDEIIANEKQLIVKDRGHNDIIATATGDPYRHNFTGNVTELCPVGALTSKTYRFKSRPWDLNRTQTSCTQCGVGCQQFVDTRAGTVLRTMSVETDDAISDGWLCDRGRYNVGFYASPERITQPLYRQGDQFVQIGWDDAFNIWSNALLAAQGAGKNVGAIGGGRLLNEEAYLLQHVFRAAGVKNLDWRAGRQLTATPGRPAPSYETVETAAAILLIGGSVEEIAPVLWLRVLKAQRHGAKVIHCTNLNDALAQLPSEGQVVVLWDGVDKELGMKVREAMGPRGGLGILVNEQPNARGAEAMGMLPADGGLRGQQMLDGSHPVEVLSLFGVNPVRNAGNPEAVAAALKATPFVMVSELFMTETAKLATLILPARGAFEKSGTTTNNAGQLLPVNQSLTPREGTLSDLEMLVGLAQKLNIALPTVEELEAAVIAKVAAHTAGPIEGDSMPASTTRSMWDGGGTAAHDATIASLRNTSVGVA